MSPLSGRHDEVSIQVWKHSGVEDATENVCALVRAQVEVQQRSKAVIVQLLDQAAVNDKALLDAMSNLRSPANFVRRDLAPE